MQTVIRPPVTACAECARSFTARTLDQRPELPTEGDNVRRWSCPCGHRVQMLADLFEESKSWTVNADDYERLHPTSEHLRREYLTDKGNPIPRPLGQAVELLSSRDKRVFVVAFLVLALVVFPDQRRQLLQWLVENW